MGKMKIAQIIPTLDRSGAEKQLFLLCRELKKRGHELHLAVLTRTGELEAEFREAGIPVTIIGKPLKIDPFSLVRLARWLKHGQFEIVQSWLFAANSYTRAAAAIAFGRKRSDRPGLIATEMAVDLWKSGYHFSIDRKLADRCDFVVGNSDAVVAFYRDTVGIAAERLRMIYSGIEQDEGRKCTLETKLIARQQLKLANEEGPVILFAGRLAEQKRVEDLLKSADILQHLYPKMKVIIAGDGPLKSGLISFCRDVDLSDKVIFAGHCAEMQLLYAASDIVVLPSSYEGLPNVVMEAQLRAMPVVAAAAPGTVELVKDRETGLTYPIGDSTELARLLQELIRNPDLADSLGNSGQEMICRYFSVGQMADKFEQLFEETRKTIC